MLEYWQKQTPQQPLFADIEWEKPVQKALAGKLCIIGGNKLGFASVASSYTEAVQAGAGSVRIVLPDALKKAVPADMTDAMFVPTNPSGGMERTAEAELLGLASWADEVLLAGDAGRNSETAMLYENLLNKYAGMATITRDAVDLLRNTPELLAERPNTLLVVSFAQLQKLFQSLYYPKTLLFSMQLTNLVDTLHKFTITYPVTLTVLHKEHLIVASGGNVTSTPWDEPMAIWRGSVAAKAATYWLWTPKRPLEAVTASLI